MIELIDLLEQINVFYNILIYSELGVSVKSTLSLTL